MREEHILTCPEDCPLLGGGMHNPECAEHGRLKWTSPMDVDKPIFAIKHLDCLKEARAAAILDKRIEQMCSTILDKAKKELENLISTVPDPADDYLPLCPKNCRHSMGSSCCEFCANLYNVHYNGERRNIKSCERDQEAI